MARHISVARGSQTRRSIQRPTTRSMRFVSGAATAIPNVSLLPGGPVVTAETPADSRFAPVGLAVRVIWKASQSLM